MLYPGQSIFGVTTDVKRTNKQLSPGVLQLRTGHGKSQQSLSTTAVLWSGLSRKVCYLHPTGRPTGLRWQKRRIFLSTELWWPAPDDAGGCAWTTGFWGDPTP